MFTTGFRAAFRVVVRIFRIFPAEVEAAAVDAFQRWHETLPIGSVGVQHDLHVLPFNVDEPVALYPSNGHGAGSQAFADPLGLELSVPILLFFQLW